MSWLSDLFRKSSAPTVDPTNVALADAYSSLEHREREAMSGRLADNAYGIKRRPNYIQTRWQPRHRDEILAAHSTVSLILRAADLQPHRSRYWKTPKLDGAFIQRAAQILWCYENALVLAAKREIVLCVDEKPNIQVLERLRRIDWVDVLACRCGGRRAYVADISDSEVVVALLAHLGLPPFAPPIARARSPAFDLA